MMNNTFNPVQAKKDRLYLDAILREDTDTLKSMIDSEAKLAGLDSLGQHATKTHFREFDPEKIKGGNRGRGFYFSEVFFPGPWGTINYSARIPPDKLLLDWNEPLESQPELIQNVVRSLLPDFNFIKRDFPPQGEIAYERMSSILGSESAASETLDKAGVLGIKYLEWRQERLERGDKRGRVIFNTRNIKPADIILYDESNQVIPLSKRFTGTYK